MAKLFVSYSRRDSVTARKLIEALRSIEQDVWVDWESIPPAVDWLEQIFRGIEESDAFLFLISPDSIASEVCKVEVARAALNNKRIIPIVLRDVPAKETPENISKLNWTFLRETDSFEEGLAKVKTAIELDLDWLEEHRRLQVRALEWHRKKDISLLLRGRDLRNAQKMVSTTTAKDPPTTELQRKFILHSKRSERNRIFAWIATGMALITLSVLTYYAIQQSRLATANEKLARENEALAMQNEQSARENEALAMQNEQIARENERIALFSEAEARAQKAIAEENKKIAEAQRGVARAQIYQSMPGELYTSTLLAIDSWQSIPSSEAEEILRRNISLLPLPVAQVSQSGKINALEFSPKGSTFVTASADGTACVWEASDGRQLFCATSPVAMNDAAFSRDGTLLITGDDAGRVQILNAESGKLEKVFKYNAPVRKVNIRPDGRLIAIARQDGKISIVDLKTRKESFNLQHTGTPSVTAFSSNGRWLTVGSNGGGVTIWDLDGGKILAAPTHRGTVLAVAFSPNNKIMLTGGKDNNAILSTIGTGQELRRISSENWVRDVAFSPSGSWFVTVSDDHRIRVWDTATGKERVRMLQDSFISDVKVSSNGQWIATTGSDKTVRLWDAVTGAEILQIPLDAAGATLVFSNDTKYLISSDERGATYVWDISVMAAPVRSIPFTGILENMLLTPSGSRLTVSDENRVWVLNPELLSSLTVNPQGTPTLAFKSKVRKIVHSPDSTLLGIVTEGNEVGVYNMTNRGLKILNISGVIRSIAFSPDSKQLLTSNADGTIQAWDAVTAALKANSEAAYPQALSFATGSQLLATGSRDKITVMGVDGNGGVQEMEAPGDNALLVLSRDGSLLASVNSSGRINIWKLQNGEFEPLASFVKTQTVSLAFDPTDGRLAIGKARNLLLVDMLTGEETARIPHVDTVNGVSFSADGNTLITASSKTLQFWNITNIPYIQRDDLVPAACARLIHNFDANQWSVLFGDAPYRLLCENLSAAD